MKKKYIGEEDHQVLMKNAMLQTKLLDYILHIVCSPSIIVDGINYCLGSTLTKDMIPTLLRSKQSSKETNSIKGILSGFEDRKH